MTSSLLMPRRCRPMGQGAASVAGSTAPTRLLDWRSEPISSLAASLEPEAGCSELEWLRAAHSRVRTLVQPVYSLEEGRSASSTLRRGRGSCSQRLGLLESLARGRGVRTRVEAIAVDGRFWYPRFQRLTSLVPHRVVLAWPEFLVDGVWCPAGELFEPQEGAGEFAFTNSGAETLFDALERTHLNWASGCSEGVCDLSSHVLESYGYFNDRDALFQNVGQTLCWPTRKLGEPLMSRISSGAAR